MRSREVVHLATQQRVGEIEPERRHLTAEAEAVEIVAGPMLFAVLQASACKHAFSGAAVMRVLIVNDITLEPNRVEGLYLRGCHGLGY